MFRGREFYNRKEVGKEILDRIVEILKDISVVDKPADWQGQKETAEERRQRERREKKLAAKKKKEREKKGERDEEEEFAAGADDEANGFDDPFFAQEPDANFDFDNVRDDDDDTIVENKKKSKKKDRKSVV